MPFTPNGKIDHQAVRQLLLASELSDSPVPERASDHLRAAIAAIWAQFLPAGQHTRPDTHFFLSGGHSLSAALCLQRIDDDLGVQIPLHEMFAHPTFSDFCQLVAAAADGQPTSHDVC